MTVTGTYFNGSIVLTAVVDAGVASRCADGDRGRGNSAGGELPAVTTKKALKPDSGHAPKQATLSSA